MNIAEQVDWLMQGTEYGDERLKQAMQVELHQRLTEAQAAGRPLRVYCGYDPRRPDLHIGHTVTMRKLRQFQELGHDVTFLIGTYTSLIGDPDQSILRPQLTSAEVEENARTYAEQAFRILDREKITLRFNAEWLSQLNFADLIRLASNFTIQQFLGREAFKQRWENGDALYVHEMFYPIMQGYDAYALKADVQVGGTDQLFNIVTAARKVMVSLGERPNVAIIMGILPGTDGVIKMSKSLGNHIPIHSSAEDMFGKVMSIPDFVMPVYARLVTRWAPEQLAAFEQGLRGAVHPRDAKMQLAREITACFYDEAQAEQAQAAFVHTFQQHAVPEDLPTLTVPPGTKVIDLLLAGQFVGSRSEARRMIDQKGVRFNGEVVSDVLAAVSAPGVLQIGRRHFVQVELV